MVREATCTNGVVVVCGAVAVIAVLSTATTIITNWRYDDNIIRGADRAYSVDYTMPHYVGLNDTTESHHATEAGHALALQASQFAIGIFSTAIMASSLAACIVFVLLVAGECLKGRHKAGWRPCDLSAWNRHSIVTVLLALLSVAITCEAYYQYIPAEDQPGIFGTGPILLSGMHIANIIPFTWQVAAAAMSPGGVTIGLSISLEDTD